ncbi:hypothetical protein Sfulv_32150 [Streptomyces fulvorobeus]|uniref:Heat shock protein HslJ n=2 Tax=Streptomyces fulvorobeus TaxID=284028 RepID=A0A7J0C933_9ACTN|nr:heat shock protein HslJ [Streptomyces fulvorobeus]GFM98404.1 hypothetical protein Sfulv_32150 [Streptomyces fulvorobeus]
MALSVLALLTLAACGTEPGSGAGSGSDTGSGTVRSDPRLTDVRWSVRSMTVGGKRTTAPAAAHLTIGSDGRATGNLGCNHYTADARVEGGTVTVGPGTTTEMACEKDVQDFENALARALDGTLKADVRSGTLTLTTAGGDTVTLGSEPSAPVPLAGTTWTVTTLLDGETATSVPAGTRDKAPRLTFGKDGTVEGSLGCNSFRGTAKVTDTAITFGPLVSTRMMCGEAEMDVERSMLAVLRGKTTYTLDGHALSLTAQDGKGLGASAPKDEK